MNLLRSDNLRRNKYIDELFAATDVALHGNLVVESAISGDTLDLFDAARSHYFVPDISFGVVRMTAAQRRSDGVAIVAVPPRQPIALSPDFARLTTGQRMKVADFLATESFATVHIDDWIAESEAAASSTAAKEPRFVSLDQRGAAMTTSSLSYQTERPDGAPAHDVRFRELIKLALPGRRDASPSIKPDALVHELEHVTQIRETPVRDRSECSSRAELMSELPAFIRQSDMLEALVLGGHQLDDADRMVLAMPAIIKRSLAWAATSNQDAMTVYRMETARLARSIRHKRAS